MPGFLGYVGPRAPDRERFADAAGAIDLLGRTPSRTWSGDGFRLAVAKLHDSPLAGPFLLETDDLVAAFAGDLHDRPAVPWEDVARGCLERTFTWPDRAEGHFALAAYDRRIRRLYLFSDHFGCHPVFYARHRGGLAFSTQLAAFVRLGAGGGFDRDWFHRFLYFGYWPGERTFLQDVRRLPPATVLTYDVDSGALDLAAYEEPFVPVEPPLRGEEAIARALAVFRERVPPMFGSGRKVQFALSGGLDSRTLYAFLPDGVDHAAFTYGMSGCDDQSEAAVTASRLGVPHRRLYFDEAYVRDLPRAIHETVWLSGGLAWINRCMLPAVYRFVAAEPGPSPILSSGIALDTLFRGHNNARGDLSELLRTGRVAFRDPAYEEIVPEVDQDRFRESVTAQADELALRHGDLSRSASYLSYTAYTLCPSYFTADLEIGGHYASLRVPGYDRGIVKLAYELEYSTVYLSKFIPHDRFDEFILQANLMASHPRLARVPLQGIPLSAFTRSGKLSYHLHRTWKHGLRKLRRRFSARRTAVPIEDWGAWFGGVLAPEMRAILGPECLIRGYVRDGVLADYLDRNRWPWLARLATAELILQLMGNGWRLEELPYPGVRLPATSAPGDAAPTHSADRDDEVEAPG